MPTSQNPRDPHLLSSPDITSHTPTSTPPCTWNLTQYSCFAGRGAPLCQAPAATAAVDPAFTSCKSQKTLFSTSLYTDEVSSCHRYHLVRPHSPRVVHGASWGGSSLHWLPRHLSSKRQSLLCVTGSATEVAVDQWIRMVGVCE